MYRKKSRGWYKHKDFIFLDLVCLLLSLILAYLVRNGSVRNIFELGIYHNMIFFVILADLFLIIIFESYKGVLRRGYYQELRSVIQQMILIELASGLYLFTVSNGHSFSRTVLYLMGVFYVLLSYGTRIIWKKHLIHKMAEGGEHSLYIVTNYDLASKVIQNVKNHNYNRYNINGLIIIDKNIAGREIEGIPVVADLENAASYICQQWVDEVFVNVDTSYPYPHELINELLEMGMAVHVNLAKVRSTPGQKQFVETIGGYTVLTTTMNYATDRQALAKRALDILGGLVGCLLTGIIFIFVAPAIYISSPGPIFFSQIRIGQNGKPFKMYKFRSMYMDAEERRAELMAQNKMSDGRMFKIDFDPRVIGNKILPDGTRKTGIGEFIRKTSLDEFPQFWNVLNGTMSLVGTRPILQDELQKYELHHRARIAIKPGITGMWQVSGRSDMICEEDTASQNYKNFLESNKEIISAFFSDSSEVETDSMEKNYRSAEEREAERQKKRELFKRKPHNIRSLKCAIQDFKRIYCLLDEKQIDKKERWLTSFLAYVLSFRAGLISESGKYGTLFSDNNITILYSEFYNDKYITNGIKQWVRHGVWDQNKLDAEFDYIINRDKATAPEEKVRVFELLSLDEKDIEEGYPGFLEKAYNGEIKLEDYENLLYNRCWARKYRITLPDIEWEKIHEGVNKQIKKMVEMGENQPYSRRTIFEEDKEYFLPEEWKVHETIKNFLDENILMFEKNKTLYINLMRKEPLQEDIYSQ